MGASLKKYVLISLIFIFSCIDLVIEENQYNSLNFKGGSWIELPQMSNMKLSSSSNKFSLQFWISGGEVDTNQAPALFSLTNSFQITIRTV